MALPPVGVRLVSEDATKFDSALKAAGSTLDGFGKVASSVTAGVNSAFSGMASAVSGILAPIGNLFDRIFNQVFRTLIRQAVREVERFIQGIAEAAIKGSELETSISRLGVTFDNVAKSAFGPFVDQLGELVNKAAPAFLGIVQAAETYLGGLGQSALTWGSNFVNQFAQGMWDAIGSILQVLTDIANMVTYWLSPGSPPRLLPDIDKWGTAAANEFFSGWAKADFSVFNDLSSTLTNLIRSIPIPKGDQVGVVPNILGARQGIAAAVEELRTTGTITKSTMDSIIASVGTADDSVRGYLESMIRLQAANDMVQSAQEELNKVTKVYQDLLKPIDAEIAGISEEQQQLADEQKKSLLQLVINDPSASAASKRAAQLEIERMDAEKRRRALLAEQKTAVEGAKDKLDLAKEAQTKAQDEFDSRKALIAAQTEQNNLLKEQLRLLEALNKAAGAEKKPGGGKPEVKPFGIKPFDFGDFVPPDILAKWQEFLAAFGGAWTKMLEVFQPAIDVWNKQVIPAWNGLVAAFTKSIPLIEKEIAHLIAFTVQEMGITLPVVFDHLATSLNSLTQVWTNHGATIISIIGFIARALVATLAGTLAIVSGFIALGLNNIAGFFDFWSAAVQGKWSTAWGVLKTTVITDLGIIGKTIKTVLDDAFALVGLRTDDIVRVWKGAFAAIQLAVDTVMPYVERALTTIFNNIRDTIINGPLKALNDLLAAFQAAWAFFTGHDFSAPGVNEKPGGGSTNAPSGSNGIVNAPSRPGGISSGSFSTTTVGSTYTYAPTYVSPAPPPDQAFTTMVALFS